MPRLASLLAVLLIVIGASAQAQVQPDAPALPGPSQSLTPPSAAGAAQPAIPVDDPTVSPTPAVAMSDAALLPHDLSPWGMFMAADVIVKAVMLGLAFASLVTWTVWLAKSLELAGSTARMRRSAHRIASAASLADAGESLRGESGIAAEMVRSAGAEVGASQDATRGVKERVASRLERLEVAAGRRMMRGTGVLATIGSTAPFVGLFGTVWGIMNAFVGISRAQTTNLAVVAPGIAEALLATAIGLVAAIPAVVIYNVFARWIAGYRARLADVSAEIQRLVSRDLDRAQIYYRQAAE